MRAANPIAPALLAIALSMPSSRARAHPHVWVSVKATVLYDKGSISGLQQAWTFDEYSGVLSQSGSITMGGEAKTVLVQCAKT